MEIKGFIGVSLSDWDGKVSAVMFLPGCNMRCPFCYNKDLVLQPDKMPTIEQERIEKHLQMNRKWIDGVVITGGEPTLHDDLPILCEEIKKEGFKVKLDTNGTNPTMIRGLIKKQLADFVALDVKAPLNKERYKAASGMNTASFLEKIGETIQILLNDTVDYEFRTTLVPTLHQIEDIEKICQSIRGCKKYALQNFRSGVETIDPRFQSLKPFSRAQLEDFLYAAKKLVPNTVLRG